MRKGLIKKIIFRLILGIAAIPLTVIIGGLVYEQFSRFMVNQRFSPEGELLEVNGHKIHYLKQGSGTPTVVFESGLDSFGHLSWYKVEAGLVDVATTFSYDRSGVLWSERGESAKTLDAISDDLSTLLLKADAPKPYIVVGHSLAGITLRQFIDDNKENIIGIVLVDASHPEQAVLRPPKMPSRFVMSLMTVSGLIRFTSSSRRLPNTEPEDRINHLGVSLIHGSTMAMFDEAGSLVAMAEAAQQIDSFGDIPLAVISATGYLSNSPSTSAEDLQMIETRQRLQSDLLNLSRNSWQIEAEKSAHYVQLEEPTIVISAIQSIISNYHSKDREFLN